MTKVKLESPFIKIGDKLIVLNKEPLPGNKIAPPLQIEEDVDGGMKLKQYEALEVFTCACGQTHINVGLTSVQNYISCYNCTEELPRGTEIHWCHPSRFKVIV